MVLHDADPSLKTFFHSCLSREFSDTAVAEATCEFLIQNQRKLLASFSNLLPQFFPLLLKLIAWNWEKLEKSFLKIFPGLISPGSFLPLFSSILDLPMLVVALEKVEISSGSGSRSRVGGSISSIQKSAAPEVMLLCILKMNATLKMPFAGLITLLSVTRNADYQSNGHRVNEAGLEVTERWYRT